MKNLSYLFISILIFACSNPAPNVDKIKQNMPAAPPKPAFIILKVEKNDAAGKCNMDVQLSGKPSVEQLTNIAYEIKSSLRGYDSVYIFYTLQNMKPGSHAWATTHFTPTLKVEIQGATELEEDKVINLSVKGNEKVLGNWFEEQSTSSSYVLLKRSNMLILRQVFKDRKMVENPMTKRGSRLDYMEDMHGEYFIINKSGNLDFYNAAGKKFAAGQKVH